VEQAAGYYDRFGHREARVLVHLSLPKPVKRAILASNCRGLANAGTNVGGQGRGHFPGVAERRRKP
jgi:hypothetical protein